MMRPRRPGAGRYWPAVALFGLVVSWFAPEIGARADDDPSGGATTVVDDGPTAFGRALANLDPLRWNDFRAGKERFLRQWPQRGPWADARGCSDCHFRDGRAPASDAGGLSHILRLGGPGVGDPIYGIQLRRTGVGVPAPGQFDIRWDEVPGRYPSGERFELRRPQVRVRDLAYGPIDSGTRASLRVPAAVFGLGLLEAVTEGEILAIADVDDADGDGVSGRTHTFRNPLTGREVLGRFGWKAAQPSLAAQSAAALLHDIGVTIPESELGALVQYLRALAVPARRRPTEPAVIDGEQLFAVLGCGRCHRSQLTTGDLSGWPELSGQTIRPYTDLLLHDMGPELADSVSERDASGSEWRTPPLWGLGLLPIVNGPVGLLHDGRARSPEEAILWHGGEAQRARDRFLASSRRDRDAILAFLAAL